MDRILPVNLAMALLFSTAKEPHQSSGEDLLEAVPFQPVVEKDP
jgi:hypothetical protein